MRTLVIPDLHGHHDRLIALLGQEGLLGPCPDCDATGDRPDGMCARCHGDGVVRTQRDSVEVVLLGDVGHFGAREVGVGDLLCWQAARDLADVVLWGNHDRAVVDPLHEFSGFLAPHAEVRSIIDDLRADGRLRLAHHASGHLLTHAGLAPQAAAQLSTSARQSLAGCVAELNALDGRPHPAVDAIGPLRGGERSAWGGILWRDWREDIDDRWPQICGHTRAELCRTRPDAVQRTVHTHWCLDVADQHNGRLTALWLPELKLAQVDLSRPPAL